MFLLLTRYHYWSDNIKTIPLRIRKFNQAKCVQNLPKHTKKGCTNHAIAIPSNNTPNVGRIPAVVTTVFVSLDLVGLDPAHLNGDQQITR